MRKVIIAFFLSVIAFSDVNAQNYEDSRYYNQETGKMDYSNGSKENKLRPRLFKHTDTYIGLRIGPAFTVVNSDYNVQNSTNIAPDNIKSLSCGSKVGLNIGLAIGTRITGNVPLYIESGMYYTAKGGKGSGGIEGGDFVYNLGYLEFPLVFKYKYSFDKHFRLEPFFGGYIAAGVGGLIKNYITRTAQNSFAGRDDSYSAFDGGLRFGVGGSYDMFYMEMGYDLGLANICHNAFDSATTGAFLWNFGVNF